MKRKILIGLVLAGTAILWILPRSSFRFAYGKSPSTETIASAVAPHWGEGGVPQFEYDPSFPKVPSKWRMGGGTAIAADSDGNIWVLSRPKIIRHPWTKDPPDLTSTPAPPVMEFDNNGNFIQGWGGKSGPGYQWPSDEHGIYVDNKGFVWIVGAQRSTTPNPEHLPNDNQVLKFTKDGKFVMAIGNSGQIGSNATEVLSGATSLFVNPKTNELFVSDGYGNSRIMVYDADTGKFKRMWGAYGHKPLDEDQRPKPAPLTPDPWRRVSEVLQQFGSPIHDVKISNDGLVYTVDRGNRRIQVFTQDGKFLTEQFVGIDYGSPNTRSIAFSPDPGQRFMYVGGSGLMWILNRKTLEILGEFKEWEGPPGGESPGHLIAADDKGNLYAAKPTMDPIGSHVGAYKYTFKGYSPKTSCPPCDVVRHDLK